MEIRRINYDICKMNKEKISNIIYKSVKNSLYTDSFTVESAVHKCEELEEYLKDDRAISYGAFDGTDLIGFVWAYNYPFRDDKNRLYVSIVYVDELYRGKSIGSKLLECVEEYARGNNYSSLFLHTEGHNFAAQGFYKSLGFSIERLQLEKKIR